MVVCLTSAPIALYPGVGSSLAWVWSYSARLYGAFWSMFCWLYCWFSVKFTFVSFAVVVSIAKKWLNGSGSSIMSTVSTDSTEVLEQDYKFSQRITLNSVCICVDMCYKQPVDIVKAPVVFPVACAFTCLWILHMLTISCPGCLTV